MMYCLTAPLLNGGPTPFIVTSVKMAVRPRLTVARIKEVVAGYYDIPLNSINSGRRSRAVARPRQVAMYLARELTLKSLPDIGRIFNRDHTTVIHGCRQIERLKMIDGDICDDLTALRARLAA